MKLANQTLQTVSQDKLWRNALKHSSFNKSKKLLQKNNKQLCQKIITHAQTKNLKKKTGSFRTMYRLEYLLFWYFQDKIENATPLKDKTYFYQQMRHTLKVINQELDNPDYKEKDEDSCSEDDDSDSDYEDNEEHDSDDEDYEELDSDDEDYEELDSDEDYEELDSDEDYEELDSDEDSDEDYEDEDYEDEDDYKKYRYKKIYNTKNEDDKDDDPDYEPFNFKKHK